MKTQTTYPLPALKAENISSEYFSDGKRIKILKNVSADFYDGKATAIIGESGSGKTTLALALMRLIMPWEGRITDGKILLRIEEEKFINILSLDEKEMLKIRSGKISFIPQDASAALNPVMKISEQMEEAIKDSQPKFPEEKKSILHRALESVKLPPERILNSYPHQLSGGQKQRVMIATALINSPRVVIADEPTSGLDAAVAKEILSIFSMLKNKKSSPGTTPTSFIFITHDIRTAAAFCDDAIILYAGKLCEVSTVKSIIRSPLHPYTQGLMESLPDINKISGTLKPLEGYPPVFSSENNPLDNGCPFAPRCRYRMEVCSIKTPPIFEETSNDGEKHRVACFLYNKKDQKLL